nr:Fanconi anemia group A protein homolog [Halyomorpha halys]
MSPIELPLNLSNKDVLNMLIKISERDDPVSFTAEEKQIVLMIISELKRGYVDPFLILDEWLKVEGITPPLQLLWALDIENLLKFTTYVYFNNEYCTILNEIVSCTILNDNENHIEIKKILTHILGIILNMRHCIYFQVFVENILSTTITKVLECFESSCVLKWQYLEDLKVLKSINSDLLSTFLLDHMKALLSDENSSYDFSYTLNNHAKLWVYEKLPPDVKAFLSEMISGLGSKTVLNTLSNAVLIGNFNWKYLLSIISVFIQQHQNSELLKGMVDEFSKNSLEEKNKTLLFSTLIIARHCCTEKARYFNNYPTWFSSLNLKNIAVFTFFFECLTQIVPDEPPLYLKIHVNKVPTVPASCRKYLTEYLTLCKTRLSDLNETTDYIGIFNDYYEKDEEGQEADVRRAMSIFQENQEIPKPLLEASVFRKQYYEKVFLRRLLSVPESSDSNRAELIKKLHSAGKISNTLFNRWVSLSK